MEYKTVVTLKDGSMWDNFADSDPLFNLQVAIGEVELECGRPANYCALGPVVWQKLSWHPDFQDLLRSRYLPIVMTRSLMAWLLGLRRIYEVASLKDKCILFYCKEKLPDRIDVESLPCRGYVIEHVVALPFDTASR